jgi:bilin biosynthesis protein
MTDRATIERLIAALDTTDPDIREANKAGLQHIGTDAVEPLLEAMHGPNTRISWQAAAILGGIPDPRWIGPMKAALLSRNPLLGNAAALALETLGPDILDTFLAALDGCHLMVRLKIVAFLEKLGDRRAVEPLIDLLRSAESPVVIYTVIQALGAIGDPRAVAVLEAYAEHENHHVRERTRIALLRLAAHKTP